MQRLLAMCLLLALAMMALAPWAAATEDPTWEVGDETAMGTEEDFSELFDAFSEELLAELDDDPDVESYLFDNQGTIGLYYTSEVVDDSNGLYRVDSEIGFYVHVYTENAVVFNNMPVAGYYTDAVEKWDEERDEYVWDNVPTVLRGVQVEAGVDYVVRLATTGYYTNDGLDLEQIEFTLTLGASFNFRGTGFPEEDYGPSDWDWESDTETYEWYSMKYHDVAWSGSAETSYTLKLEFDPALNLFDLPIVKDEVWGGVTDVTFSGEMGGVIDLDKPEGVPDDILIDLYDVVNEGFQEGDINKRIGDWDDLFPLYIPSNWMPFEEFNEEFQEDDIDFNLRIENNRFVWGPVESPEPLYYNFTTGEKKYVTLADGTIVEAFEIVPYEDEGRSDSDYYWDSGTVIEGETQEVYFYIDEDAEGIDIYYSLYGVSGNGTDNDTVTVQLSDPYGNVVREDYYRGPGYGNFYLWDGELDEGQYTLGIIGEQGEMSYDVEIDVEYRERGPFGDLELIPYVGADSGQIVDVDVESEELTDMEVDLDIAPVTPAEAQDALATKTDTDNPSRGGVNEDRDWGVVDAFFSSAIYSVNEDAGNVTVTVTLSNVSQWAVTVDYKTEDGSAISNMDYTRTSGTLTFLPGETNKTFQIPIFPDEDGESDETIILILFNPGDNALLGDPNYALIIIEGDSSETGPEVPENSLPAPGLLAAAGLLAVVARRRR